MPGPQVCGGCPFIHGFVGRGQAPSAAAREPAALRFSGKVGAGLLGVEDAAPLLLPGGGRMPPYTAGPGMPGPYGAARENGHKKSHRQWETVGQN